MVAVYIIQEIMLEIHLGQKLFGSLWLLHDRMQSWLLVRILPTSAVKMVNKSRINETYSFMKFSTLSLSLSLLHDSKMTCIQVREDM
jgi:hypothetical protein